MSLKQDSIHCNFKKNKICFFPVCYFFYQQFLTNSRDWKNLKTGLFGQLLISNVYLVPYMQICVHDKSVSTAVEQVTVFMYTRGCHLKLVVFYCSSGAAAWLHNFIRQARLGKQGCYPEMGVPFVCSLFALVRLRICFFTRLHYLSKIQYFVEVLVMLVRPQYLEKT